MLNAVDLLFPQSLRVNDTTVKKCLVIGSCMSEDLLKHLRSSAPSTEFDYVAYNNVANLPAAPPNEISSYDMQLIQLPARSVLGDGIVRFNDFMLAGNHADFLTDSFLKLEMMLEGALKFNADGGIITLVTNFIVPQLPAVAGLENTGTPADLRHIFRRLNLHLDELVRSRPNTLIVDIESIASFIGKRYFLDDGIAFFTHGGFWFDGWHNDEAGRIEAVPSIIETSPSHLNQFFDAIWEQVVQIIRTVRQTDMVKLVIFDIDDTLWRGQIAEHYGDGVEYPMYFGWPLGISEAVHHLRARGILVALCSKNTEEVVRARWERAAPLNWLKLEDFVACEINWAPKAENITKILKRLSLTARSVVFVDDNPVERNAVVAAHPEIRVLGSNPFLTRSVLLSSAETQVMRVTAESAKREVMIQAQQHRELERGKVSREEFLVGLRCVVAFTKVHGPTDEEFYRCFELLNKTNQFNTTGKRWTKGEIDAFFSTGGVIYAFRVSDKYTEYGLVGVILFKRMEFVQFVMSCRVLGLDVETTAIKYVLRAEMAGTNCEFAGSIKPTDVNIVSLPVYSNAGFSSEASDPDRYAIRVTSVPNYASHITVVE